MSPPPNTHRQDRKDEGMGGAGVSFKNKHTPQDNKHLPSSLSYSPLPHLPPHLLWLAAVGKDSRSSIQPQPPAPAPLLQRKHMQPHSVSFLLSFFPLLQAGWSLFALKCLKKVAYQAPVVFWKAGLEGRRHTGVVVAAAVNLVLNLAPGGGGDQFPVRLEIRIMESVSPSPSPSPPPPPPPSSVCRLALPSDKHKQQQGDVVLLTVEGRTCRRVSACCDDSPHAKARNVHAHILTANGPALASQPASQPSRTLSGEFDTPDCCRGFHITHLTLIFTGPGPSVARRPLGRDVVVKRQNQMQI